MRWLAFWCLFSVACGGRERADIEEPARGPDHASEAERVESSASDESTEGADTELPRRDRATVPPPHDELALGGTHSCLLRQDGSVRCWGGNQFAQLGDPDVERGRNSMRSPPARVAGIAGAVDVAAGTFHTCALSREGLVACWGHGGYGQLGDGGREDRPSPVPVVGVTDVVGVAAGHGHTCALLATGRVVCWGRNLHGQLGDGTTVDRLAPVQVMGLGGAAQIVAGRDHTCALLDTGQARCWGADYDGALGDGELEERQGRVTRPVEVSGLAQPVTALASGGFHVCALLRSGQVQCWGAHDSGQLGVGEGGRQDAVRHRAALVPGLEDVEQLVAGSRHTCAQRRTGQVVCWGANGHGQLGDTTREQRGEPTEVTGLAGVATVGAGARHTCAVVTDGSVRCWGGNLRGQIGDGSTERRTAPVPVEP